MSSGMGQLRLIERTPKDPAEAPSRRGFRASAGGDGGRRVGDDGQAARPTQRRRSRCSRSITPTFATFATRTCDRDDRVRGRGSGVDTSADGSHRQYREGSCGGTRTMGIAVGLEAARLSGVRTTTFDGA